MLNNSLLPPFLTVKSGENRVLSIIISAAIALWIAFTIALLPGAVYLLFKDADTPFALSIVLILIGVVMNGIWIYVWKRSALTRYTNVTINEQGIFYYNRYTGKPVREVKWQDFRVSPNPAVFKNRGELIAGLLLGLAHFRPELTIDKSIFSTFYIDEQQYVFKKADQIKMYFYVIIFCIIVFLLAYVWVNRK